jgi:hypothetical protein
MHIERTHGFGSPGVPDGANHPTRAGESRTPAGNGGEGIARAADPLVEPYIGQAAAAAEIRWDAVKEARTLLLAGMLDTPDAARQAAENILLLGI